MDSAVDRITHFMFSLESPVREVAPGEWVLVLDAAGYVLDVAVAVRIRAGRCGLVARPRPVRGMPGAAAPIRWTSSDARLRT